MTSILPINIDYFCCQFTSLYPCLTLQDNKPSLPCHIYILLFKTIIFSPLTTFKMTMSTKQPHQSSNDEFNVRRFIDDVAVEMDGEEEVDDEEEDPDQSESPPLYPFYLAQLTQHNFLLMTTTATPLANFIMIPMIVLQLPQAMQRRLPRSSSKLKPLINVRLASPTVSLTVNPCIRQHNKVWTWIVLMSQ